VEDENEGRSGVDLYRPHVPQIHRKESNREQGEGEDGLMRSRAQEDAINQIRSNLAGIERHCLKLKQKIKKNPTVNSAAVDSLIDVVIKFCQQQRGLLSILGAKTKAGEQK